MRTRHGIQIFAYVIMPDHVHMLAYADKPMSDVLRLLNGVSARRIVQHLQENGHQESLSKLRGEVKGRNHKHSVWHHHTDSLEIFSEDTFRQKVEYIHQNPVRARMVGSPEEYRFSSARHWSGDLSVDQPLLTDHSMINWR